LPRAATRIRPSGGADANAALQHELGPIVRLAVAAARVEDYLRNLRPWSHGFTASAHAPAVFGAAS
jgi:hypothetical protein